MFNRKHSWLLGAAVLGLLLGLTPLTAAPAPDAKPAATKEAANIDVVLCLDVSGSMRGLIDSAKVKLWDIVNDLAKVDPAPNLRVSLYSYGHSTYTAKSGWVRKEMDLTVDLDGIYEKLNGLTINGGKEYVGRVCHTAILDQKWSEDKNALKLIFVAGNEAASQDPEVSIDALAAKAIEKGIVVNPIFCGSATHRDAQDWKKLATLAKGQFASIDQNRGTVVIATPHDKKLAELSSKLSTTYLAYGVAGKLKKENQKRQDANAAQQGQAVAAARAQSKASGLYRNSAWDLVDKLKNDPKFDITKLTEKELPECLKKLKPEERLAYIKKMSEQRAELQKQITDLQKKRQAFIAEEQKKNPSSADKAFDRAVRKALREQAADKGIRIPE